MDTYCVFYDLLSQWQTKSVAIFFSFSVISMCVLPPWVFSYFLSFLGACWYYAMEWIFDFFFLFSPQKSDIFSAVKLFTPCTEGKLITFSPRLPLLEENIRVSTGDNSLLLPLKSFHSIQYVCECQSSHFKPSLFPLPSPLLCLFMFSPSAIRAFFCQLSPSVNMMSFSALAWKMFCFSHRFSLRLRLADKPNTLSSAFSLKYLHIYCMIMHFKVALGK